MAQKTDLNVNPYYDDFDKDKNFYRVLYKPGYPVQSRELNNLQSILQNQIESFGTNIFKEGTVVVPGSTSFDNQFNSVKINQTNLGIDVSIYINNFIGKTLTGSSSGVKASLQYVALPSESDLVDDITLYVKYLSSGDDSETDTFQDGEFLTADENVVYGNTTITANTPFASLVSLDATSIGSAVSIDDGVYFVRGTFVDVSKQTIILDYYTNTPDYRVGLKIDETIVRAKDDESLYDNAKGFTNYAAPGADRLKISLTLTKKLLTDLDDTDFIEILRIDNGNIKKVADKTVYNVLRDYIAERTFDESGHYTVDEFIVDLKESLNDRVGNDGLFLENETTDEGNVPSDDLMCVQVSPGKAYVAGYDVELDAEVNIDVEKPRDTQNVSSVNVPFEMGHLLRVNNVSGAPKESEEIELKNRFKDDTTPTTIGKARVYTFNLTDAAYSDAATQWDLYLYDIQTYTNLTFNRTVTATEIPTSSYIQGKSSGASGYVVSDAALPADTLNIYQTSGTFVQDEQLIVNGVDAALSLSSFTVYSIKDIKSVSQSATNFPSFEADSVLNLKKIKDINQATLTAGTFTSPAKLFSGIKIGDIIAYQSSASDITYNRVTAIDGNLTSITVGAINTSVSGVFDGSVASDGSYRIRLARPRLRNKDNAFLYANLPNENISSVDLSDSQLAITRQIDQTEGLTVSGNSLSFNLGNVSGITSATFESFDQERYSIHYTDGSIASITSDAFNLSGNTVTISGLANGANVVVNATLLKNNIQSKIKNYTRSAVNIVNLSRDVRSGAATSDSLVDGLSYNQYYGLRVQDNEISLNIPDASEVIAVYESTNTSNPILDRLEFSSISQVDTDAIIGEDIIGSESGAVARIVLNSSTTPSVPSNNLGIVYLNSERFVLGETVTFNESNIKSILQAITFGKYKNITNNFTLDKGQRDDYYDYSRLVRIGTQVPERRLLIVFDHYTIPVSDNGDVFTVLSYDADRFSQDIPTIGDKGVRASDTLDFRPRVQEFVGTTSSPFDFASRDFGNDPKFVLKPGEGSLIGYDFYLPRIDRVYLDKFGNVVVRKGISSTDPQPPTNQDFDLMYMGEIGLPAYLYDVDDASIELVENRRYTMRDIGSIEDRVENLERYTSLSLLEVGTESLRIEDSDGNNRFKSGIFVDDFADSSLSNDELTNADIISGQLRPRTFRNSLQQRPIPSNEISEDDLDLSEDYELLDPNVQKTGNAITLKYDSVKWLEQTFATTVENVNPFHVVEYIGEIKLSPNTDAWVRTIRVPPKTIRRTVNRTNTITVWGRTGRQLDFWSRQSGDTATVGLRPVFNWRVFNRIGTGFARNPFGFQRTLTIPSRIRNLLNAIRNPRTSISRRTRDVILSSGQEKYIRSRNVSFFGTGFRPLARHYQFFDSHSNVNFIPKLVEIANDRNLQNYGTKTGSFQTGETVTVWFSGRKIGTFRLASSNHKTGKFNSPKTKYSTNPYVTSENIPSAYSQSSKTLNIDLNSLSAEAQGKFNGYLKKGARIVGKTSGAVAYVKKLRLISDVNGTIFGSMFIKNPHTNPAPNPRISTGRKTYKLTSSKTNEIQLPGSKLISSGETVYTANGRFRRVQKQTTVTTTVTRTRIRRRRDPLAQSFTVGRDIGAPDFNGQSDDDNGVFLTAVDLFFSSKPGGNEPLTVEIRTMQLGIPTLDVIGESKTLTPDEISISSNGKTATKVTFDTPIYLPPGDEYALVLLAPTSDQYEVWTAKMGEKTIDTKNLPAAKSVKYSKQFAIGSLFKSQNGSIWTPAQESDLKFKLYKAKFTTNTGIAHFGNPPLSESNGYIPTLQENAITSLPKSIQLGISTITDASLRSILSAGRRIAGISTADVIPSGTILSAGGPVSGITTTDAGINYATRTGAATQSIIGNGTGLVIDIDSVDGDGAITGITVSSSGNGYAEGDIVSIVNGSTDTGRDAIITISTVNSTDTLYLTNAQGQGGATKSYQVGAGVSYYDTDSTIIGLGVTQITSVTENTDINSGNFIKVDHFNHGMYANNNKLILNDIKSDVAPTVLTSTLTSDNSTLIDVEDSTIFENFEGQPVSVTNPGYVKIADEIIGYISASSNQLSINSLRGVEGPIQEHVAGSEVMKYEYSGISLRRINGVTHDISDIDIRDNSYYVEIDRGATYGVDRTNDGDYPQVSFTSELIGGGDEISATENILFNRINPKYDILSPGSQTSVTSNIRATTGTSINGSEVSFNLQNGVREVTPNEENELNSVRMICSRVNELNQSAFNSVSGNRSFNSTVTLNTTDENLSPMIFIDTSTVEFISDNINRPITDFVNESGANSIFNDPHSAVYVSNTIEIAQPATSLKVILSAYRPEDADIRVLYQLVREDSTDVEQQFELFPGYDNLESTSDGVLKVVDTSLNNGRPDVRVPASQQGQFLEYEFTANDLSEFIGYRVKIVMSSSNQADAPIINDLRTIALA